MSLYRCVCTDFASQGCILLLKPLMRLHTIEMMVAHHRYRRRRQNPKSEEELDLWMAAAREALAGHEGRNGRSSGGKRIRMSYRWVDHMNLGENQQPVVHGRFEEVEVE